MAAFKSRSVPSASCSENQSQPCWFFSRKLVPNSWSIQLWPLTACRSPSIVKKPSVGMRVSE